MPALVAAIAAFLARAFSLSRLFIFVKKLLSFGLFTVGIPLAMNWGIFKVASSVAPPLMESIGLSAQSISLTGLGAWIAVKLQLPLALSVYLGFVSKRFVYNSTKMGGMFSPYSKYGNS